MNIKELKELIAELPDDMLVGNSGHYGEFLEVVSAYVTAAQVEIKQSPKYPSYFRNRSYESKPIFLISTEDPGDEPS